jgi:tRNA threonylcarbamoyladenosine biosynthesis protein TsaB
MLLLAFDTSTRYSSVALCSETELLSEYTWFGRNNHSIELLSHMQRMMKEYDETFAHLDAVAVARGPGMFNGVRVGLSTAKALAFATDSKLIGVVTLDIIASQQQYWRGTICAVMEAGRGEVYAAIYRSKQQEADSERVVDVQRVSEYLLTDPQQLATLIKERMEAEPGEEVERVEVLFCGEIGSQTRQVLAAALAKRSVFVGEIQSTRRAATLALCAMERLRLEQVDDPLVLEPLYLRRPSITKSVRKQPLLGGLPGQATTEREEGALRH